MQLITNRDHEPLLVIVSETEYNCYGTTLRAHELFKLLQSMGGINHTVAPGFYYFNAEVDSDLNTVVSLDPV